MRLYVHSYLENEFNCLSNPFNLFSKCQIWGNRLKNSSFACKYTSHNSISARNDNLSDSINWLEHCFLNSLYGEQRGMCGVNWNSNIRVWKLTVLIQNVNVSVANIQEYVYSFSNCIDSKEKTVKKFIKEAFLTVIHREVFAWFKLFCTQKITEMFLWIILLLHYQRSIKL